MTKRHVKCFSLYTNFEGYYNIELFYPNTGGWSDLCLFICLECGELFVSENYRLNLDAIRSNLSNRNIHCPKCKTFLSETIANYPDRFLAPNGKIGKFNIPEYFSSELEVKTISAWDLISDARNDPRLL